MLSRTMISLCRSRMISASSMIAPVSTILSKSLLFRSSHAKAHEEFVNRHVGSTESEIQEMLKTLNHKDMESFSKAAIPSIYFNKTPQKMEPLSEFAAMTKLRRMATKNVTNMKSMIGMGYYRAVTPAAIQRYMHENPSWYTPYTPYQAEISQGRLEALLNFQTMVSNLCGLPIANASLLDDATSAAEAMLLCKRVAKPRRNVFFIDKAVFPHCIDVCKSRAEFQGIDVVVGDVHELSDNVKSGKIKMDKFIGVMVQYPGVNGAVVDYKELAEQCHHNDALMIANTDLMAMTQLVPPGQFGADVAFGSIQRFGLPLAFGGPSGGFMACTQKLVRQLPGRIIGVTKDKHGKTCYRMAIVTREQHIRREKATSNICTSNAMMANMAGAYAVFHGPKGLKAISNRIHSQALALKQGLNGLAGVEVCSYPFFDTIKIKVPDADHLMKVAEFRNFNFRKIDNKNVSISCDEQTTEEDVLDIINVFHEATKKGSRSPLTQAQVNEMVEHPAADPLTPFYRKDEILPYEVFHKYHTEMSFMRYIKGLVQKDLALDQSMTPLGSCTMKLNAAAEMIPESWAEFQTPHPFAPHSQTKGTIEMIEDFHRMILKITGFKACTTQPNSGAAGEYTGLLTIRRYLKAKGQEHRNICLIPTSAHGTNPASSAMAGFQVVNIKSDAQGQIDLEDMKLNVEKYKDRLGAFMITFPSTYGVFDCNANICIDSVHKAGGLVYMDGANMNAQCCLVTPPGIVGFDCCHLNLHKTFAMPHGGGGPGVGTVCVSKDLAPFLPGHSVVSVSGEGEGVVTKDHGAVSSGPYGSAMLLPISWMYLTMLGWDGVRKSTQNAILNANYMARKLESKYNILYRMNGYCGHEFIVDLTPFKSTGITEVDIAKRLVDFGIHAPTMSWPVHSSLMIEPTESEPKKEMDRFCDAMLKIYTEIQDIASGKIALADSPLKNAPHTLEVATADKWPYKYSRSQEKPVYKFWPSIGRIDDTYGDLHFNPSLPKMK